MLSLNYSLIASCGLKKQLYYGGAKVFTPRRIMLWNEIQQSVQCVYSGVFSGVLFFQRGSNNFPSLHRRFDMEYNSKEQQEKVRHHWASAVLSLFSNGFSFTDCFDGMDTAYQMCLSRDKSSNQLMMNQHSICWHGISDIYISCAWEMSSQDVCHFRQRV